MCIRDRGTLCPIDWYFYNGYCYYPSSSSVIYKVARRSCLAMGADLASISNQDEMDFVLSISYEPTLITDLDSGPIEELVRFVCMCLDSKF